MRIIISVLLITYVILSGCTDEDHDLETQNACNSDNPIENVTWIKNMKNSLTNCTLELSIIKGTYEGQTVFFTGITDGLFDGIYAPSVLYDCNGELVRTFTIDDFQDFYGNVTRDTVLYRCKTY
jgi:hypothetical protein